MRHPDRSGTPPTAAFALPAWCRAPAMWMICAVLGFTLVAGIATLRLAFAGADPAVLAAEDYSQWRDEMRGTGHSD